MSQVDPTQLLAQARLLGIEIPGDSSSQKYAMVVALFNRFAMTVPPEGDQRLYRDVGLETAARYLLDKAGEYHSLAWKYKDEPLIAIRYEAMRDLCYELKGGIRGMCANSMQDNLIHERRSQERTP